MRQTYQLTLVFIIIFIMNTAHGKNKYNQLPLSPKIPVQLANVYDNQEPSQYLISEKYDGVRAIWKDGKLKTRNGNTIQAPLWFTKNLPSIWLDGELWIDRAHFESVLSIVSKKKPNNGEWQHIKYMIFDAPNYREPFKKRVKHYTQIIQALSLPHLIPVKQTTVDNSSQLKILLNEYVKGGAEGIMLHKADALFSSGRSDNLLKLKKHMDGEAIVIAHYKGKGKYANFMGAILVKYINTKGQKVTFKIGSGFSDKERKTAPEIGSLIHFRYQGYTNNGIPRFATYIRTMHKASHNLIH